MVHVTFSLSLGFCPLSCFLDYNILLLINILFHRCSDGFDRHRPEWLSSGCNATGIHQVTFFICFRSDHSFDSLAWQELKRGEDWAHMYTPPCLSPFERFAKGNEKTNFYRRPWLVFFHCLNGEIKKKKWYFQLLLIDCLFLECRWENVLVKKPMSRLRKRKAWLRG